MKLVVVVAISNSIFNQGLVLENVELLTLSFWCLDTFFSCGERHPCPSSITSFQNLIFQNLLWEADVSFWNRLRKRLLQISLSSQLLLASLFSRYFHHKSVFEADMSYSLHFNLIFNLISLFELTCGNTRFWISSHVFCLFVIKRFYSFN